MPRGGARVRSGPPPDPNAIRRNRPSDRNGFTYLPAAREGDTPPWPFPRPAKFELDMWTDLWTKPQAVMWERLGLQMQVALYVRSMKLATASGAPAARMRDAMSLMDRLGLTPDGMARNRWLVADPTPASAPRRAPASSAKDRLAVIQGGSDARAS